MFVKDTVAASIERMLDERGIVTAQSTVPFDPATILAKEVHEIVGLLDVVATDNEEDVRDKLIVLADS